MLLRTITVFIMLFTCARSGAQVNLIRNPSFEIHDSCAIAPDEITFAYGWNSLDSAWRAPDWAHDKPGVPELCNACAGYRSIYCGVPASSTYFQYPRTGSSMAQIQVFYNDWDTGNYYRDYLQGHLSSTLISGQSYCVSFYVVEENDGYAVNKIGAYLDDGSIDSTHFPGYIQTQYTPQVLDTAVIADTLNWTRIEGSFIANGTEKYVTIGNFTDTAHMRFVLMPGYFTPTGPTFCWYLVDDISVFRSDATINAGPDRVLTSPTADSVTIGDTLDSYLPTIWYVNGVPVDSNKAWLRVHPDTTTTYVVALQKCGGERSYDTVTVWAGTTGVAPAGKYASIKVYPNPATDEVSIIGLHTPVAFRLLSVTGTLADSGVLQQGSNTITMHNLAPGIYILEMTGKDGQKSIVRVVKE